MNRKVMILIFLLFMVSAAPAAEISLGIKTDIPQEKTEAQIVEWDFGQVKAGSTVTHTFVYKNDSPETVHIKDITTSCGCTASEVKKKTIPAGETSNIEVTFKSKGYSGDVSQNIFLFTDSQKNPIMKFVIKANVTGVKKSTAKK